LVDLCLLIVDGQWDGRVQAVTGSLIQSVSAGLIVGWIAPFLGKQSAWFFAASIGLLFSLPFGYENTLWGFQSQVFLLLFLAVLTTHQLTCSEPLTLRSCLGLLGALLSLGTMASGLLAGAATLPILFWQMVYRPRSRPRYAILGACICLSIVLGFLSLVSVPENAGRASHSLQQFLTALLHFAAWPRSAAQWPALIYLLPWTWLMIQQLRRRAAPTPVVGWIGALGIWSLLQMAALAYARKDDPPPRYTDIFSIWVVVNLAAAFLLLRAQPGAGARKVRVAVGIWAFTVTVGLTATVTDVFKKGMPSWREDFFQYERNVGGYVNGADPRFLNSKIPYPRASVLRELLVNPDIRRILPASVRPSLKLETQVGDFAVGVQSFGSDPMAGRLVVSSLPALTDWKRWQSKPLAQSGRSYWRFYLIGQTVGGGLNIFEANSGRLLKSVSHHVAEFDHWTAIDVPNPHKTVYLEAQSMPGKGFSFVGPVESSFISHWANCLTAAGPAILGLGTLLLAVIGGKSFLRSESV
jgi:hypothetical protein